MTFHIIGTFVRGNRPATGGFPIRTLQGDCESVYLMEPQEWGKSLSESTGNEKIRSNAIHWEISSNVINCPFYLSMLVENMSHIPLKITPMKRKWKRDPYVSKQFMIYQRVFLSKFQWLHLILWPLDTNKSYDSSMETCCWDIIFNIQVWRNTDANGSQQSPEQFS